MTPEQKEKLITMSFNKVFEGDYGKVVIEWIKETLGGNSLTTFDYKDPDVNRLLFNEGKRAALNIILQKINSSKEKE